MPTPQPGTPKVWLWGDSHAAHLYPGLRALLGDGKYVELTQLTAATCPPIENFDVAMRPRCRKINDEVIRRITTQRPDLVLLAANWSQHNGEGGWGQLDLAGLQRTAKHLVASGVGHVVIVGQMPRWKIGLPVAMLREWRDSHTLSTRGKREFNTAVYDVDAAVRSSAMAADIDYFAPLDDLCNAAGCEQILTAGGQVQPMAWDDAHLTTVASEALIRRWQYALFKDPRLQTAIRQVEETRLNVTKTTSAGTGTARGMTAKSCRGESGC